MVDLVSFYKSRYSTQLTDYINPCRQVFHPLLDSFFKAGWDFRLARHCKETVPIVKFELEKIP